MRECHFCKEDIKEEIGYYIFIEGWLEKAKSNSLRSPTHVIRHNQYAHKYCIRYIKSNDPKLAL